MNPLKLNSKLVHKPRTITNDIKGVRFLASNDSNERYEHLNVASENFLSHDSPR